MRARGIFFFFEVKKKSMRGQKMTRAETRNKVLFFFGLTQTFTLKAKINSNIYFKSKNKPKHLL